ncbi:arginase family protein [Maridesulfovibrio sp.]|uniref:arginase family protein n=1 Tax=Maridesulfovibrio sp. TaxID=2795000 RepID=UPI002A18E611|nr:arginase family protein [Maridesulfovibrio sp.]
MEKKDLTLVFPQWQGSIDNIALYDGALELAGKITGLPALRKVNVPPYYELEKGSGIVGKEDIVRQLIEARSILEKDDPDRILLLGGDCSTEAAPVSWLNRKFGNDLALVWFDAHPDLNNPRSSISGRFQGMALAALLGQTGRELDEAMCGSIKSGQIFCAGQQIFDPHEMDVLTKEKIRIFSPGELEIDPSWLAKQIRRSGFGRVYIHLDVDAVNPMGFPHGKKTLPAGISFNHLLAMIEYMDDNLEICGLGITEFHPGSERGIKKAEQLIRKTLNNFIKSESDRPDRHSRENMSSVLPAGQ